MKTILLGAALSLGLAIASGDALAKGAATACKFSDAKKLSEHLDKHISYPAKGKDIKAACQKELPDEFTKAERACVTTKLKDDQQYKSAEDVRKALGVTM